MNMSCSRRPGEAVKASVDPEGIVNEFEPGRAGRAGRHRKGTLGLTAEECRPIDSPDLPAELAGGVSLGVYVEVGFP